MSSQYQGDVMENLFDEGPEGQVHFDEEGFDEEGFEAEGFDEDGFDEEGFDEEGFDEDGFDEDGFDEDTPDHGDAMELAVADALDAEDADEFFGSLLKKVGRFAKKALPVVGKVMSAIPLPMTQAIGGVANTIGGMLADEADEGEAFDGMLDFAEDEDAFDAAAPVIAGLALRKAAPQVKTLPLQARRQAVKTVTKAVHQLARRHGTAAVAAMPAIVHTARRHLAARRLPAAQLPAMIRKVAAHAHRNPRALKTYVKRGPRHGRVGHGPSSPPCRPPPSRRGLWHELRGRFDRPRSSALRRRRAARVGRRQHRVLRLGRLRRHGRCRALRPLRQGPAPALQRPDPAHHPADLSPLLQRDADGAPSWKREAFSARRS